MCQLLEFPEVVFFNKRGSDASELPTTVDSEVVLFRLWVARTAPKVGNWIAAGSAPIRDEFKKPIVRFKFDSISKQFSHYVLGDDVLADRLSCVGLERAAVWDAFNIADRLRLESKSLSKTERLRISKLLRLGVDQFG